ncbi:MAG: manganese efflux pump [Firmicutes bacterium]|nr:manganese efflux pump [Bacillota bacterium]
MFLTVGFLINSILFGVALAMDAFSVSVAAGLANPGMQKSRMARIAGTFCFFQIAMPLIGWVCVHTVAEKFTAFQKAIPWIALVLLVFLGGRMIAEELAQKAVPADMEAEAEREREELVKDLGGGELVAQGIATSIDALSVGFTIAELSWQAALTEALIIGAVTFAICMGGLRLGRAFGTKLAGKAGIVGGVILIAIGLEIFIKGVFGS